ncbi:protein-(glutamine-N5) methyltransferase [Russula earlei]|uniref:Protein-(Glutamine-N5) methyltransferase n=1 Tax=Russula earlei TaxID=71964 RepID=A0ACC0TST3_9AGAM|nr:protein-(glutamine-N5) methyltransferase [Russula earlei]
MTMKEAYLRLLSRLYELYADREAATIADWVIEHITGMKRIDRIVHKNVLLSAPQQLQLADATERLLQHEPVQYVLGEAWFAGMRFYVDRNVLIPRPETEELVEWTTEEIRNTKYEVQNQQPTILDIGTGSGCIPIALYRQLLPNASVTALDVSEGALKVAKQNAIALAAAPIDFLLLDFLNEAEWQQLPLYDIITSNPPYIKQAEAASMNRNVLDFEPATALFVEDNDPLIFYRKIAAFGKTHLAAKGALFVEINEALGLATIDLFKSYGYQALLRQDLQGRDRMIKAWL